MKRHASLRDLSGEHHAALSLARALMRDTPQELTAGLPPDPDARVREVRARWERDLAPHFAVEERELLPLSDCGDAALRAHATRIRTEHGQLRKLLGELSADDLADRGDALGRLLQGHVRFEEREWFPALEAALEPDTLDALARRLKREPESLIAGFHQDADGVWVAELDCGHARHVRHRPPLQRADWVTTEAGRNERIGAPIPCVCCRMPRRPPCARAYKSTPVFDAESLPNGLRHSHRLRDGTWGEIEVIEGRVAYVLEHEGDLTLILRPGVPGIVAPGRDHHVELQPGARVRIHFLRCQ